MYSAAGNLSRRACEFADSLLADSADADDLSEAALQTLMDSLNGGAPPGARVLDVSDVCVTHLRFGARQQYYLTHGADADEDDAFERFSCVQGTLYETLESFFVLVLDGELRVNYATDRLSASVRVSAGEAFFMDVGTTHALTSACAEVRMLVVRCQMDAVFAHHADRITCSSPVVYERFFGVNFARYRLMKKDAIVKDLLLANRSIYDARSREEVDAHHLAQVLEPYCLRNCPLPEQVPESPPCACFADGDGGHAGDEEGAFERAPTHYVLADADAAAGGEHAIYTVKILYGVCFK
ncbi:concanavalin-like precursor protein [Equine molluscum contagiosum-like virus]|nr:concanavalin-like precursor protein [Equine molluscum contagiosum-like virus]